MKDDLKSDVKNDEKKDVAKDAMIMNVTVVVVAMILSFRPETIQTSRVMVHVVVKSHSCSYNRMYEEESPLCGGLFRLEVDIDKNYDNSIKKPIA